VIPFRIYLIHRTPRKRGEVEEIEVTLQPIKEIPAITAESALSEAYGIFPLFFGRLCVGPLPLVHHKRSEIRHAPALAEVE
jgi:hypothetical protein